MIIRGKRLMNFLFQIIIIYLVIVIGLFFFQEKLIFFPQRITNEYSQRIISSYTSVEEIKIKSYDETTLHGWLVKDHKKPKSPLIIYYGGNGEEVSHMISYTNKFEGYSLLLMNYRGYGLSEGSPNEKSLKKDGRIIYDEISKRRDIDNEKVIVMGRSIGTGLAVDIAKHKNVDGVILITPYDTLVNVAQKSMRIIPVSLIMRNRFESIKKAPLIDVPLLALAAKDDEVIPYELAKNLVKEWKGDSKLKILEDVGHNTIQNKKSYWESIQSFLENI